VRRGQRAADYLGAQLLQLDVTDDASVSRAAAELTAREGHLDVLINNAGIFEGAIDPEDITGAEMHRIYDVNVFGIVRMTHAFLPLLRAAHCSVIVNVGSGRGSFGVVTDPKRKESTSAVPIYASSKAAVSMLTLQYAKALPDIRINVIDPGYTATDLTGHAEHQTVTKGTDAIVSLATIGLDRPHGTFSDRRGALPW
jgi:NAD(P)-dependent dehydrogenase (short-subunit alcohol dehydrogenase family)